jgi:hypothetical protein
MSSGNFIYFADKELARDIGRLEKDATIAWWSEGRWSMHDLLMWILQQTGKADICISTFSISEAAIRSFFYAKETEQMGRLDCLFDHTISRHKLALLMFADNTADSIRLTNNHSKIMLVGNDQWKVTVVASANMTPNPRKEAGVIFTQEHFYNKYLEHFREAFETGIDVAAAYENIRRTA